MKALPVAAGAAMALLLAALAVSGHWPGGAGLEHFTPHGIVTTPAADIARITIAPGDLSLTRQPDGWTAGGKMLPPSAAAHIETALRFLTASAPLRSLADDGGAPARFGLDRPTLLVTLTDQRADAPIRIAFGTMTPTDTGQYVQLDQRLFVMSRHVGAEWALAAGMIERHGRHMFLPAPLADIWAVEIVAQGKLTRFERDGAGDWFHHTGQHSHTSAADAHKADPTKAGPIAAALAILDGTTAAQVPAIDPAQAGLQHPPLILLLYERDSSTAVARIEIGNPLPDESGRYIQADGAMKSVAGDRLDAITTLLRLAGTAP